MSVTPTPFSPIGLLGTTWKIGGYFLDGHLKPKGEKSNLGKETSWSSYCQLKEVFDLRVDGGLVVGAAHL